MVPTNNSNKKTKKKPPPTAPGLSGTWRYPLLQKLVDKQLAISMGLTDDGGKTVLPHGTYTDIPTFTVYMSDKDDVINAILDIFDENGNFCHFVWNGSDTWNSQSDPIPYNFEGDSTAKPPLQQASIMRYPTLLLAQYDSTKGPWDICPNGPTYTSISGDGASAPAQQLPDQCITQEDVNSFIWHLGKDWGTKGSDPDGLEFTKVTGQQPMPASFDSWGKVFVAQSGMAQLDFPYYGFDPRNMDVFSLSATSGGSGTGTPGNKNKQGPGGSLDSGALIFEYPAEDSTDYVQGSDVAHQPYLPLGTSGIFIEKVQRDSSNQMASTLADTSHSWSATLGLSAGVEGLLNIGAKGTYGSTIEQQQKNESRFTITRNYGIYWTCFIDRLSMKMTEDFRLKINDRLNSLMAGETPDWQGFVSDYGTHYLYAMTQGDIEFSLTEFTFESSVKAFSNSVDISTTAEAIIEGGTVKTEADFKNELKNKTGTDFSNEIAHYFGIGQQGTPGVGIFFDLRPLTELMSPIFFPYDPDDSVQKLAPWVWYNLRESFSDYLTGIGLNKQLDESFLNDFTPHQFKVTVQTIKVAGREEGLCGCGSIMLNEGTASTGLRKLSLNIPQTNTGTSHAHPPGVILDNPSYTPDPKQLFCILAAKSGDPLSICLDVNLAVYVWFIDNYDLPYWAKLFVFNISNVPVTLDMAGTVARFHSDEGTVDDYIMEVDISVEDLGPLIVESTAFD